MKKPFSLMFLVVALIIFAVLFISKDKNQSRPSPVTVFPTPTASPIPMVSNTTPSITSSLPVSTPTPSASVANDQPISYPVNWPLELHYPSEFVLYEAVNSMLADGTPTWSSRMRHRDNFIAAADVMEAFLLQHGWHITKKLNLGKTGIFIATDRNNNKQTGAFIIHKDPLNASGTEALAVVGL